MLNVGVRSACSKTACCLILHREGVNAGKDTLVLCSALIFMFFFLYGPIPLGLPRTYTLILLYIMTIRVGTLNPSAQLLEYFFPTLIYQIDYHKTGFLDIFSIRNGL